MTSMKLNMEKIPKLTLWNKWKRPASIPYPNTWHKFTAKSKDGKEFKIKIVDVTPDRFEESLEFIRDYLYSNEPLCESVKMLEDEISLQNELARQNAFLQQRITIMAVLDEDVPKPEMIAVQKLFVASKDDDPEPELTGNAMSKLEKIIEDLYANQDQFEIHGTDAVLKGFGLCVKPNYWGMNIGYNIVLCLEKIAKAYDLRGCMTMYTSIYSQAIVTKAGFKVYNEIFYDDYKDEKGNAMFPNVHTKSIKLMGMKYS
ncbi:uncharacterized protein LOC135832699 [Planococcus citri]|uniref:uncharacterized protein LOC135832699 n=1 Tax=Planococcus citri TaxID=170843 RepID=UPI0031F9A351